jgi:predicted secreted hydrolase
VVPGRAGVWDAVGRATVRCGAPTRAARIWVLAIGRLAGRAAAVGMAMVSVAVAAGPLPELGVLGGGRGAGSGFAQVLAPRTFEFPRDHGSHPDYRQEWWYVTGNLDAANGERFGFELTFFRFALAPSPKAAPGSTASVGSMPVASAGGASPWRTREIYMAHFAITDVARGRFRFSQKLSRGAAGLAGAQMPPLHVWVDDWSLAAVSSDDTRWRLRAGESGYELTLDAQALLQPVLNGDEGFSRKSSEPGAASYYYSIPRVGVHGQLLRDGKPLDVHGLAWVDREWGSGPLDRGWDWFALQLGDGSSLMFYALRGDDNLRDPHSAGTWTSPTGESRKLSSDEVQIEVLDHWTNPRGDRYPSHWRVRAPTVGVDVDVRPALKNQELTGTTRYWEGAVNVTAASAAAGQKPDGRGYVELVGYAAQ